MTYSRSVGEYDLHMEELRVYDKEAYEALLAVEPKTWCLAFFSATARCADISNNLSESFNMTIKKLESCLSLICWKRLGDKLSCELLADLGRQINVYYNFQRR